jgi:ribosomal-protein-alanine N-acetyltransferase
MVEHNLSKNKRELSDKQKVFFVRILTSEELDNMFKIESQCCKQRSYRTKQDLQSFLKYFICYGVFEDSLQGFAVFNLQFEQAELIDISIAKQSVGIGTVLLEKSFIDLKQKGCENVVLEVGKDNFKALGLYKKFGAKKLQNRINYYKNDDGSKTDALVLQIFLNSIKN